MTPMSTSDMHLLVVLQTHSLGDSQSWLQKTRYCQAPKSEVTKRCVRSLINSMNQVRHHVPQATIELMVLDDHSDDRSIADLQDSLSKAQFDARLISLETRGIMPSILACYQYGLAHGKQWVYFAQDDYLYDPKALTLMLLMAEEFSSYLPVPASIYPFDDPYRYHACNTVEKVHIVRGGDRHWRTNYHTASCFMTHHQVIRANWDLFYAMGTAELSSTMEDDTINQLFIARRHALFTPIPSLALHLQFERENDPFINWRALWDLYSGPLSPELPQPRLLDKSGWWDRNLSPN